MRSQGYQNKLLELLAENNKDEDFNQNQVEDKHQIDKNRLDSLVRDSLNEVERYKNSLEGIQKKRSVKDTKLDQIFGYKDTDDEENENPNKTGNSRSPGVRGDGPTSIGNVVDPGDDDSESGQGGKKRIKKFNIRP